VSLRDRDRDKDIDELVKRVVSVLANDAAVKAIVGGGSGGAKSGHSSEAASSPSGPTVHVPKASAEGKFGIFGDVGAAAQAARAAHEKLVRNTSLEVRARAIEAARRVTVENLRELAVMAVEETGLGRVEDKIEKNRCAALKTPGMEILSPRAAHTGDHGLTLDERAPYGVIASITPSTNCTETIINNGISMLAGGNAVVFNTHPSARRTCTHYIRLLNQAMTAVGAPDNLFACVPEPNVETATEIMRYPLTRIVVVTGGPAVVKAALSTGKKVIAAGPGNPPALVDETAHLAQAGRDIVRGASLDNNIVCIVEKEVFAVRSIADRLKEEMQRNGAYFVSERQIAQLEKVVLDGGYVNRNYVGKNASVILKEIGVSVPDETRVVCAEVNEEHPFVQLEMLMPVLAFVRVADVDAGIQASLRAEHGNFHTATMHSTNIDNLDRMARAVNCSLFVKNGPSFAGLGLGGEGYTSWTIAGPTGEGLTTAWHFTRMRRCTMVDHFRIV
jgi:acyl-CoA reductase-like NAD-dependent aldehyde dehydrogenase